MGLGDAPLMGAQQPTLEQGHHPMHPWQLSDGQLGVTAQQGRLSAAPGTLPEHCSNGPRGGTAAMRAPKPLGPAQLDQVRTARLLGREARLVLGHGSRIIFHGPGTLYVGVT